MAKYQAVIGLEVHAQLLTESKIFCGCSTRFGGRANANTCPVCAGFPGALPVLNRQVVEFAVCAGLATGCAIARTSRLARKSYFYPDLPKGYQISQYELPLCANGYLDIELEGGAAKRVRLTRIHVEEDAGKSIHDARAAASLVDLNRAGVPLLEIVSEPELESADEARRYLKTLRAILQYLAICNGNMEEGSLRCDANVSVRREGSKVLGTKVEIKNLNSFKALEKAILYEIQRQSDALEEGGTLIQETRLWDDPHEVTRAMRSKESAHDYRYFPDPDLPPIIVDENWLAQIRASLPELPDQRRARLMADYKLPAYDAELLTARKDVADYFESALALHGNAKALSNWIVGDLFRVLKERKLDEQLRITDWPIQPQQLGELVALIDSGKISGKIAKGVFDALLDSSCSPQEVVAKQGLEQVSDIASIDAAVDKVLAANAKQAVDYRDGNEKVLGFLVGQVMRATHGKANPKIVNEILKHKLSHP
jgi:aspartyl-tRNA(Asn)/glutamyl-tRNA(Gln) amidotransferase subunit B